MGEAAPVRWSDLSPHRHPGGKTFDLMVNRGILPVGHGPGNYVDYTPRDAAGYWTWVLIARTPHAIIDGLTAAEAVVRSWPVEGVVAVTPRGELIRPPFEIPLPVCQVFEVPTGHPFHQKVRV